MHTIPCTHSYIILHALRSLANTTFGHKQTTTTVYKQYNLTQTHHNTLHTTHSNNNTMHQGRAGTRGPTRVDEYRCTGLFFPLSEIPPGGNMAQDNIPSSRWTHPLPPLSLLSGWTGGGGGVAGGGWIIIITTKLPSLGLLTIAVFFICFLLGQVTVNYQTT